jgi:hypothetical protein
MTAPSSEILCKTEILTPGVPPRRLAAQTLRTALHLQSVVLDPIPLKLEEL